MDLTLGSSKFSTKRIATFMSLLKVRQHYGAAVQE